MEPDREEQRVAYPQSILDPALAPLLLNLHRAVELEALWDAGTALLRATMPHYHFLVALPCVGIVPMFLRTSLPIRDIPNYWGEFIAADPPLAAIVRDHPGAQCVVLSDYFTVESLQENRFYHEFMVPDGWLHAAAILFWEGDTFLGQFSAIRTPAHGDYTETERALWRELQPHFDIAVKRVVLLDRERGVRQAIQSGFEHAPEGRLVLDWNLQPVFQTHAAVEACALWNGHETALKTSELSRRFAIPAALGEAAAALLADFKQAIRQGRTTDLALHREIDHPEVAGLKARLQILEAKIPQAMEPNILIEFSRVLPSQTSAAPIYALTAAERRVAEKAAAGGSNEEIARDLHLSVNTVRAHLREIFAKLGIARRSQLGAFFRLIPLALASGVIG